MLLGLAGVHAGATLLMAGLCWFVQVVHYPLYALVGSEAFARYEQAHTRRTTWVVAPLMGVELASALALLVLRPAAVPAGWVWTGASLLALLWISTALVQVPLHGRLERGFDPEAARRLVAGNWVRTAAWSARGALALAILAGVAS